MSTGEWKRRWAISPTPAAGAASAAGLSPPASSSSRAPWRWRTLSPRPARRQLRVMAMHLRISAHMATQRRVAMPPRCWMSRGGVPIRKATFALPARAACSDAGRISATPRPARWASGSTTTPSARSARSPTRPATDGGTARRRCAWQHGTAGASGRRQSHAPIRTGGPMGVAVVVGFSPLPSCSPVPVPGFLLLTRNGLPSRMRLVDNACDPGRL